MDVHDLIAQIPNGEFSPLMYRFYNVDLHYMSDDELEQHFRKHQHERRAFATTNSTVSFLSMRWLRGNGLEIGPGPFPTPLFGETSVFSVDCDSDGVFKGSGFELTNSIDDPNFAISEKKHFDFTIASHVLEHVDSFIRAVENMCALTRQDGIIYIVLPDIRYTLDVHWMSCYNFSHHVEEYTVPSLILRSMMVVL